jgi:Cation transporter/ATPase, N-terminus
MYSPEKAHMDPSRPANAKPPDIASASIPDKLAALDVNPDTGLTQVEVDVRRKEHGYNEVAKKTAPSSEIPRDILGSLGMDARTDHRVVGGAQEIL